MFLVATINVLVHVSTSTNRIADTVVQCYMLSTWAELPTDYKVYLRNSSERHVTITVHCVTSRHVTITVHCVTSRSLFIASRHDHCSLRHGTITAHCVTSRSLFIALRHDYCSLRHVTSRHDHYSVRHVTITIQCVTSRSLLIASRYDHCSLRYVTITVHCVTLRSLLIASRHDHCSLRHVTITAHCVTLPAHCVTLPAHCVTLPAHCVTLPAHCVTLPAHCPRLPRWHGWWRTASRRPPLSPCASLSTSPRPTLPRRCTLATSGRRWSQLLSWCKQTYVIYIIVFWSSQSRDSIEIVFVTITWLATRKYFKFL